MQRSLLDYTEGMEEDYAGMKINSGRKGHSQGDAGNMGERFEVKHAPIYGPDATPQLGEKKGVRFAHTADCHLGAFRDPVLREYNIRAFEKFIEQCIEMNVDFILIAGDLFHTNIPAMDVAKRCGTALLKARTHGLRIYVLYGSHDYSITERSMIDLFSGVELFTKVGRGWMDDNNTLHLEPVKDESGVTMVGITARKGELDREYYSHLDQGDLDNIPSPKIFMFHTTLQEMKLERMVGDFMPMSMLPKGFDYYAGGHIHRRMARTFNTGSNVVYPGPLFGSEITDLETACDVPPGFYVMDINDGVWDMNFIPTALPPISVIRFNAKGLTPAECNAELEAWANRFDAKGRVVILHVYGTLKEGKKTDVNLRKVGDLLMDKGCLTFYSNRLKLQNPDERDIRVDANKKAEEIEYDIIREIISPINHDILGGEKGVEVASDLIHMLGTDNPGKGKGGDIPEALKEEVYTLLGIGG